MTASTILRSLWQVCYLYLDTLNSNDVSYAIQSNTTSYRPPINNQTVNIYNYKFILNIKGAIKIVSISTKETFSVIASKNQIYIGTEIVHSTNKLPKKRTYDVNTNTKQIEKELLKALKGLIKNTLKYESERDSN